MNLFAADDAYQKKDESNNFYSVICSRGQNENLSLEINLKMNGTKIMISADDNVKCCLIFAYGGHQFQNIFEPACVLFVPQRGTTLSVTSEKFLKHSHHLKNNQDGDGNDKKCDDDNDDDDGGGRGSYSHTAYDNLTNMPVDGCLEVDSHLTGCIINCLTSSSIFCDGFKKFLFTALATPSLISKSYPTSLFHILSTSSSSSSLSKLNDNVVHLNNKSNDSINGELTCIIIHLTPSSMAVNHSWCHMLSQLMHKEHALQDTMNWLSTLGGAYSSLGDYNMCFAHLAGEKSEQQLRLALYLDNPSLVMRCKLFWALSLAQRKRFKSAEIIIRQQYESARNLVVPDSALVNMCKGIWNKVQYFRECSRRRIANGKCKLNDETNALKLASTSIATTPIISMLTTSAMEVTRNETKEGPLIELSKTSTENNVIDVTNVTSTITTSTFYARRSVTKVSSKISSTSGEGAV